MCVEKEQTEAIGETTTGDNMSMVPCPSASFSGETVPCPSASSSCESWTRSASSCPWDSTWLRKANASQVQRQNSRKKQTGPWSTKRTISPISRAENEEETTAGYYYQIVCFINQNDYLVFLNTFGNYYMHYRFQRNTVNVGFYQRNVL